MYIKVIYLFARYLYITSYIHILCMSDILTILQTFKDMMYYYLNIY